MKKALEEKANTGQSSTQEGFLREPLSLETQNVSLSLLHPAPRSALASDDRKGPLGFQKSLGSPEPTAPALAETTGRRAPLGQPGGSSKNHRRLKRSPSSMPGGRGPKSLSGTGST